MGQAIMKRIIGCLILIFMLIGSIHSEAVGSPNERSTWLWDTQEIVKNPDIVMNFLVKQRVTRLYLQIDQDVPYSIYTSFLSKAAKTGIQVYALDGAPQWAHDRDRIDAFFIWLQDYQQSAGLTERFKGVHLDIEPYTLPEWESDVAKSVADYQTAIQYSAFLSKSMNLPFTVDIPSWYDRVPFKNQFGNDFLARWVIKYTDGTTIMAYRSKAEGPDGIIQISKTEVAWAEQLKKKVEIAVETNPAIEASLSFGSYPLSTMETEVKQVMNRFKNSAGFSNMAIHYYNTWKQLVEK
ncbi:amidase [Priestia koreensis]|uniref:amidase n=2 Tax=Priestia koreensis TaxID=284581 RepID=UPI001F564C32|nr:amidase [Priestia koreensis]UNL85754.1 amidase [Priestia koreensis]